MIPAGEIRSFPQDSAARPEASAARFPAASAAVPTAHIVMNLTENRLANPAPP